MRWWWLPIFIRFFLENISLPRVNINFKYKIRIHDFFLNMCALYGDRSYVPSLVLSMRYLHGALAAMGFQGSVKVSSALASSVLATPPAVVLQQSWRSCPLAVGVARASRPGNSCTHGADDLSVWGRQVKMHHFRTSCCCQELHCSGPRALSRAFSLWYADWTKYLDTDGRSAGADSSNLLSRRGLQDEWMTSGLRAHCARIIPL